MPPAHSPPADEASAGTPVVRPLACSFLYGAPSLAQCPADALPEVAFAGRSNAGKSSALNRLTRQRKLARTSSTPGRTQLINLFAVACAGRLVDLPGFGYARAPKAKREAWARAVGDYLRRRQNLAAVVLVMDCRHALQPADEGVIASVRGRGTPLLALLNKADKLNRSRQVEVRRDVEAALPPPASVLLFSAVTGLGVAELRRFVAARLAAPVQAAGSDRTNLAPPRSALSAIDRRP